MMPLLSISPYLGLEFEGLVRSRLGNSASAG